MYGDQCAVKKVHILQELGRTFAITLLNLVCFAVTLLGMHMDLSMTFFSNLLDF